MFDIEKTYCISLDHRADRWQQFSAGIPDDWPFPTAERFPAFDGRICRPPKWWKAGRGAWGCYQSHLRLLENCLDSGIGSCLILEDDAVFCDAFSERAGVFDRDLPSDWEMVYLGGQHLESLTDPPVRVNSSVFVPFNVNRMHAYALRSRTAIRRIVDHLKNTPHWIPGHHVDHHLGQLVQRQSFPVYCPSRWLVGQYEGLSSITCKHSGRRFFDSAEEIETVHRGFSGDANSGTTEATEKTPLGALRCPCPPIHSPTREFRFRTRPSRSTTGRTAQ